MQQLRDHSPTIPFNIKLLSPRARVEANLKERGIALLPMPSIEGLAPAMFATNVTWVNTPFSTLVVWYTPTSGRVASLTFVRKCEPDGVPLIVAELTDVVAHTFGDPSFADEAGFQ